MFPLFHLSTKRRRTRWTAYASLCWWMERRVSQLVSFVRYIGNRISQNWKYAVHARTSAQNILRGVTSSPKSLAKKMLTSSSYLSLKCFMMPEHSFPTLFLLPHLTISPHCHAIKLLRPVTNCVANSCNNRSINSFKRFDEQHLIDGQWSVTGAS